MFACIDSVYWKNSELENEHNWINVTELESGAEYEFLVVAQNNDGEKTKSDPVIVFIKIPDGKNIYSNSS